MPEGVEQRTGFVNDSDGTQFDYPQHLRKAILHLSAAGGVFQ
jgi:hypothetical protein